MVKNPPAMQETPVRFLGWEGSAGEGIGLPTPVFLGFPCGSAGKESTRNVGDLGLIPGLGRSPGEGKGYPLQYSGHVFHVLIDHYVLFGEIIYLDPVSIFKLFVFLLLKYKNS